MSIDIEAIRARAEEFRGAKGYTRAGAAHASAEDVPALLAEMKRLRRIVDENPAARVYAQERDDAEAERNRLRAAVDAVRALDDGSAALWIPARDIRAALDEHLGGSDA